MTLVQLSQVGIGILLSVGISFGIHSCDIAAREEAAAKEAKLKAACESTGRFIQATLVKVTADECMLELPRIPSRYRIKYNDLELLEDLYTYAVTHTLEHDRKRAN
jgi:hypothetical protein